MIPKEQKEEVLIAAMKKAVAIGMFPKHPVSEETYLKHWDWMRKCLDAAIAEIEETTTEE